MLYLFGLGLALGLSIIISIGAQNLFMIKQGLRNESPFSCAITCMLSDTVLILLGVTGLSALLFAFPGVKDAILILGVVFLLVYGGLALKRGFDIASIQKNLTALRQNNVANVSKLKPILLALSFSILNPQAILDSMFIIGSKANGYEGPARYYFIAGAICASIIWFSGLSFSTSYFSKRLTSIRFWQALEIVSGVIMLSCAVYFIIMK